MAGVYVWKSERVKNMQYYTPKKFWSLGMFINWGKNVFSQPLPCKKIAMKFVIFFFNKYFLIFLFSCDCFFVYKKLKIYEDSYFSVFLRLNVAKYVLKKLQSWNNQSVTK